MMVPEGVLLMYVVAGEVENLSNDEAVTKDGQ